MNSLLKANFSKVMTLHFVGIGGIGMSGLAYMFQQLGYKVQGSDIKENPSVKFLMEKGIKVFIGHLKENVENADIVVVSSAIKKDNIEYQAAISQGIPIFKRGRMLGELMRFKWGIAIAGTHGKTTTTSLISHIMQVNSLDPTAIIGGIVNSWGNNSRFGDSNWLVAESDESDGSFLELPAMISVVTNIETDHMDHYKDYDDIKEHFTRFIDKIPFYGFSAVCIDSPGVQDIMPKIKKHAVTTYGLSAQADYRPINIKYTQDGVYFDVEHNHHKKSDVMTGFFLPMYGIHNVLNALASIIITIKIGVSEAGIKSALKSFQGIKRRFTNIGKYKNTVFIDDYAHHPSEISAVIDAANKITTGEGKIISIVQPHRYSRLKDQFDGFCKCFNNSHYVLITDVYKAGEQPMDGYDSEKLVQSVENYGHKNVYYVKDFDNIVEKLKKIINKDSIDLVIFMGAGDISTIARSVLDKIKEA